MTTEDRTPRIGTGYVYVDAPCPECGSLVEVVGVIRSVLTVPQDDLGTIRLRLKAKPVDHQCRSHQLSLANLSGAVLSVTVTDPAGE